MINEEGHISKNEDNSTSDEYQGCRKTLKICIYNYEHVKLP